MSSPSGPHNPWDEHEELLREELAGQPEDSMALARLSAVLSFRGKNEEALRLARRAVAADPGNPYGHYALAYSLGGQLSVTRRTLEEAIAAVERAIALDATDAIFFAQLAYLRNHLGQRSLRWGQVRLALEAAERGLRIDPQHAQCECFRGLALLRMLRNGEAEVALARAVSLDPGSAYIRELYSACLFRRGKLGESIAQWREAARLDPYSAQTRMGRQMMRLIELPLAVAVRMGLIRLPSSMSEHLFEEQAVAMNWPVGLALGLTIIGSVLIVGQGVGERTFVPSAILSGLVVTCGAVFRRSRGRVRVTSGILTALCGMLWLEMSFMMLLLPQFMSAAAKAAWANLHPGLTFHVARVVGMAAVAAMAVFLCAFVSAGPLRGFTPRNQVGQAP